MPLKTLGPIGPRAVGERVNPNPHTVPCVPNRYGKRGACAGLSYSLTPSTRRSISHWWAQRVSVACLSHVLLGGTGRAGGGGGEA
jgi:hypothetical protein